MNKTIILPSCDDENRGDQALVWQTRKIAEIAGLADECKMLTDKPEHCSQTEATGIGLLLPILRHPGTKFKPNSNLSYGKTLSLMWGVISILDTVRTLMLLNWVTRPFVSLFLSKEEKTTLKEIKTADACFVKGGGFLHSTNSITDAYKAYFFLFHVMLAQSYGIPVFVMPNSFGPFKGALYQKIVQRTLLRCEVVTARETVSQDMLAAIGVESLVFPDLAFSVESEKPKEPYLNGIRAKQQGRKIVGLTARPYRFPGTRNPQQAYSRYIDEMADFARWLFEEGYFPVFIEHVASSGEHESDISAINAISKNLSVDEHAVYQNLELNCLQLKSLYSECDFVVGTRFHSVIFALSEGVPSIAIGYGGNKSRGIMRDLDMSDCAIEIENFSAAKAIQTFSKITRDNSWNERIEKLVPSTYEKHEELINIVKAAQD